MSINLEQHKEFLLKALSLAEERLGFCAPNPPVGAVVVKNGMVLSTGQHMRAGCSHAEVDALNKLSMEESEGAALYVTLEPCCHWGRTPPCVDLIISKKISAVYYGYQDPNPSVQGQGEAFLKAAGIQCYAISMPDICYFYRYYQYWRDYKRPWLDIKLAMTLDGKIAGPGKKPIAITGKETQAFTHQERKKHDAILTTAQTIIHDDPQLNVRLDEVYAKPIYVIDRELKLPLNARVLNTAGQLTVFHDSSVSMDKKVVLAEKGVVCKEVSAENNKLDLLAILYHIGEDGVHSVWAEVGGECFDAFISRRLAQRGFLCLAPTYLGELAYSAKTKPLEILSNASGVKWLAKNSEDMVCELTW